MLDESSLPPAVVSTIPLVDPLLVPLDVSPAEEPSLELESALVTGMPLVSESDALPEEDSSSPTDCGGSSEQEIDHATTSPANTRGRSKLIFTAIISTARTSTQATSGESAREVAQIERDDFCHSSRSGDTAAQMPVPARSALDRASFLR